MAIRGQAALGIWMDVLPEAEDAFNAWYKGQHLPERLAVPGFLRGRRYLAAAGAPKYFILYETEGPEVLRSPAYLERLNHPTDWTRRVLPTMRNVVRNAYRFLGAAGRQDGEGLVTLRLDPFPGAEPGLRARYQAEVLEAMARVPGVVSAALYEAEAAATGVITEERKLVGTMAAAPAFLCVCELRDPEAPAHPAWRALVGPAGPARKDVVRDLTENVFRLLYALERTGA